MGANLVTLQEYKNHASINSTNQDGEVNALIVQVSALVKTYCKRSFIDYYDEAKIDYLDGGHGVLMLPETPVVNVISVSQSKDYGKTYQKLTKFTDWVQRGDEIVSLDLRGFEELVNGYKVEYFAGYEKVPDDLKMAVLDLIMYYMRSDAAVHSTRTLSPNTRQVEYVMNSGFPSHIRRVLDLHMAHYA